jgi:hypothetical protein
MESPKHKKLNLCDKKHNFHKGKKKIKKNIAGKKEKEIEPTKKKKKDQGR